uniref:Uncharacterized protein n=1 Tax=Candidatus Kentrum sp. FM TaxID=2126340 RepID=A0A450VML0_9GAMM|nr:MAG: hypothetical protein BECKFM1743A_GA0114220_1000715 [Candidatus Kentron sp. FM]VFJ43949.1 MAG: hypothetical protein BECKFM1743C_GA0114222_100076 [Candidatus Kentron sp. FM]VFK06034.1 MAG: hypothetical protein BECKFM1743B_GA0114221_1000915 [Candidatus Kentron sp. FM]
MGTSVSSTGPKSGVPLVPPWVPNIGAEPDGGSTEPGAGGEHGESSPANQGTAGNENKQSPDKTQPPPVLAKPGRFGGARKNLGDYAKSGDSRQLKRGLRHYSKSGLGGSRQAAARMGRTARNAGALYGALHALGGRGEAPSDLKIDLDSLSGRSAREVRDRLAEAISPNDGSQDSDANRESISQALTELLSANPDVDLEALDDEQIASVVESYICNDIIHRVELDVGNSIFDKAPNPTTAQQRLDEMHSYVRQCVAAAFEDKGGLKRNLSQRDVARTTRDIIQQTFEVFEEYIQ